MVHRAVAWTCFDSWGSRNIGLRRKECALLLGIAVMVSQLYVQFWLSEDHLLKMFIMFFVRFLYYAKMMVMFRIISVHFLSSESMIMKCI